MRPGNPRCFPTLGAGLAYRSELQTNIVANREAIDFLELIADHYLDASANREQELVRLASEFPIVLHGVGMSLGTAEPLDERMLFKVGRLVRKARAVCFSEHLSFTKAGGIDLGQLTPLPFTKQAIEVVCHNVQQVKKHICVPLLLENITYLFALPHAEMSEAEFVRRVLERADCGLLLDLTNLHTNATNHGYDPYEYLQQLPLDRVGQVHVAGGYWINDTLIDSHSASVPEPVWRLLKYLCTLIPVNAVLLERDDNMPPFPELVAELETIRRIVGWPQASQGRAVLGTTSSLGFPQ